MRDRIHEEHHGKVTVCYQPSHLSNTSSFCLNSSSSILVTKQLRKWIYSLPSPAWLSIQINLTGTSKKILNFLMWEAASQPKGNLEDYLWSKGCITPAEVSGSDFTYFKTLMTEISFIFKVRLHTWGRGMCGLRLWQGIHASLSSCNAHQPPPHLPQNFCLGLPEWQTHITFKVLNLTSKHASKAAYNSW